MRSRAKFSKHLTLPKLLGRLIVMVIGKNPGQDVDDRRVALVTMKPDMAARSHGRATDPQLTVFHAVDFFSQIDGGEHRFLNSSIICGRGMLPECEASGKEGQPGQRPGGEPQSRSRRHISRPR
jgi:hypothetical protein